MDCGLRSGWRAPNPLMNGEHDQAIENKIDRDKAAGIGKWSGIWCHRSTDLHKARFNVTKEDARDWRHYGRHDVCNVSRQRFELEFDVGSRRWIEVERRMRCDKLVFKYSTNKNQQCWVDDRQGKHYFSHAVSWTNRKIHREK